MTEHPKDRETTGAEGGHDPAGDAGEQEGSKLIRELEAVQSLRTGPLDPLAQIQQNAQVLRYVHDAHLRLIQLFERDQRSEMFIQSSDALNKTFRKLHESQDELARSLAKERRSHPALVALAALAGGGAVIVLGVLLFRGVTGQIGGEADLLAKARVQQVQANDDALAAQRAAAAQLLETVNQGFAANRILENENRAQSTELERIREKVLLLEQGLQESAEKASKFREENASLARQTSEIRQKLVDQDLRRENLSELLRGTPDGGSEDIATPPPELPEPATNGVPEPGVVAASLTDPVVEGMNQFLKDAGVIDLRLLRCDGVADGAIINATFEIRSEEGFPIGFHEAGRVVLSVDPGSMTASLRLEEGATVVRGARERFPEEGLWIRIAAIAPDSWSLAGVSDIVRVAPAPAEAAPAAGPAPPDRPVFDPRPTLARLNAALREDGLEGFQFFMVGGIEAGELLDVRVHHYGRGGELRKTVVAKRCRIEVDSERRQVRLVFVDGHHVTRGREVPFFRGKGDSQAVWSIELEPKEPAHWRELAKDLRDR
ncbi:MAG: hypothetical protein V2A76_00710 [Planctomycetota bacterium]